MLPSPRKRWLGLRILVLFRGHLWVYFRYGPVTCSPSLRWLCRSASSALLSSADATQAKGLLAFAPVGLPPTEHVCLSWTHSLAKTPQGHKSRPVTILQARPHAYHFKRILDFGEGQPPLQAFSDFFLASQASDVGYLNYLKRSLRLSSNGRWLSVVPQFHRFTRV